MLSACSSYFEELLSQNPCQHPIVFMRDLKFWEVQALVEFMYSGEVNVAQEKLPSLLAAAEALQIKGNFFFFIFTIFLSVLVCWKSFSFSRFSWFFFKTVR